MTDDSNWTVEQKSIYSNNGNPVLKNFKSQSKVQVDCSIMTDKGKGIEPIKNGYKEEEKKK